MLGEPLMFYIKCKACVRRTINNITVPISEAATQHTQPRMSRRGTRSARTIFIKYMGTERRLTALPLPLRESGIFPFFPKGITHR